MLTYLDIYPLFLPARYTDQTACYTKVFISSNIPLWKQYPDIQTYEPETWKCFIHKIDKIVEFKEDGSIVERRKADAPTE